MIKDISINKMEEYFSASKESREVPKGLFLTKRKDGKFWTLKNLTGSKPEFKLWNFLKPAKSFLKNN